MLTVITMTVVLMGLTTTFWAVVGAARLVKEPRLGKRLPLMLSYPDCPKLADVAVLTAAHNEEAVIENTIRSALDHVAAEQIFIVSDGSSDATTDIARSYGVNVLDLNPNRGKAGALAAGIEHFHLERDFEVVLFLDADTELDPDYFTTGLPVFADPDVVAVAACARTQLEPAPRGFVANLFTHYRERLYQVVQRLVKYGQATRGIDVVNIVPGFASMYRSRILPLIDIQAPGLVIEDFNMTFEIQQKKLGRIEFHPAAAVAFTQDPDNLRDYRKQVLRWALGFWQTVRKHATVRGKFWISIWAYCLELVSSAFMFCFLLPLLVILGVAWYLYPDFFAGYFPLFEPNWTVAVLVLVVGVLIPDLILSCFAAAITGRWKFLLLAPFFPLLRFVDAFQSLRALIKALGQDVSTGQWVSPERRKAVTV